MKQFDETLKLAQDRIASAIDESPAGTMISAIVLATVTPSRKGDEPAIEAHAEFHIRKDGEPCPS
jgi:hypothetical protein